MFVYLNLLMMTARIRRTRTVMMAIVIILFVAILIIVSRTSPVYSRSRESALPTSHLLQCLVASIGVALALKKSAPCVFDDLSLPGQIGKSVATDVFCFKSDTLALA
jgi:branched-subunit amino acid ABC-type transport system permease component